MKKLIAFIFAALVAMGAFGATQTINGVTYTYSITNGFATIGNGYSAAISKSTAGALVIPTTLGGRPVKIINTNAFFGCNLITSVTIPSCVMSIDDGAFIGCSSLKEIVGWLGGCPNNIEHIVVAERVIGLGSHCFYNCDKIKSIVLPDGLISIGDGVFYGCASLSSVTIPDSVTKIGDDAFYNCSSLTSVTIPDSVTTIGSNVFYGCTSLTSVTLPDSVTTIGSDVFYGCTSLTSVTIPKGVTTVGSFRFYDCRSLASVSIPDSVTEIGDDAFYNCGSLTSIVIPNGVTAIGSFAFGHCRLLKSITIPNSVIAIESTAFSGCYSRKEIVVEEGNREFCSKNGLLCSADGKMLLLGVNGDVTIPDSVTTIADGAFRDCSKLTSVTIPNSVTTIGTGAFSYCSSLASVTIPGSVTTIGEKVFEYCSSLDTIKLLDGVTMIGDFAFYNCGSLKSITIPNSVSMIGTWAFSGCGSLKEFIGWRSGCPVNVERIVISGCMTTIEERAFSGCSSLTSVTIPDSVTTIGPYAFYNCKSLTSVTIGNGVATIDSYAFDSCSSLKSVTIGNSVTTIGSAAFSGCSSLTSVTIPDSVTTIGASAFSRCSSLTSVIIPDSVTDLGSHVFKDCKSLTSIMISVNVTTIGDETFYGCSSLASVTIPDSVTTIGEWAFGHCHLLESITIPNSVTTIKSSAFRCCYSRKKIVIAEDNQEYSSKNGLLCSKDGKTILLGVNGDVTIPAGVKTIEASAFSDCHSLTSVTIPDSVTTIGSNAFSYCSSLRDVHITDLAKWCAISFDNYTANPCYYAHHLYLNGEEIKDLVIPDNVTTIGSYAFDGCGSLTSVTIPDSVTMIGDSVFSGCSSLKVIIGWRPGCPTNVERIVISDSVTTIGDRAFSGCSSLTSVTIPESVTSIGERAFRWCSSLTSVTIPDSVTTIGMNAFEYCSSLTSVTLPDSVTTIGSDVFYGCTSLTSVTIPKGVTTIGSSAFSGCSSLTVVTIPDSVKMIGKDAFAGCDKLTNVIIEPNSTLTFDSSWGIVEDKIVWQCDVKVIVSNREQSYTYNCQKYQGGYELVCNCNNFDLNNIKYIGAPLPELQNVGTAKIPVEDKDFEYYGSDIRFRKVVVECVDPEISIAILPRSVSVTSASASKTYDGKPLSAMFSIEGDGFVDGECSVSVSGSQTSVGSCKNTITLDWAEGASASNYDITVKEGDLVVSPRSVSVTSASASKTYDGKPLTAMFSIEGDGFVDGECSVSVSGSQTLVGPSKNTITLDWAEGAIAGNYNLTLTEGTLTVLPAKVLVIAQGSFDTSFIYDGEEHTIDIAGVESIKLIDTPRFAYALSETGPWSNEVPTFKDAGVYPVWYKISADNYEDYIREAKVTILPRKVTLVSEDAEKFYDGDPLTNEVAKVVNGEFVTEETYLIKFTGAQLDEGESENTFEVVWDGTAKASNYEVTKRYGTFKVTRLYGEVSGVSVANSFPYSYAVMTNAIIAANVVTIDKKFFDGCDALKTVELPDSLRRVDCHAFDACPKMKWEVRGGYKFMDGWLFGYTDDAAEEIPDVDSIRGIADGALDGCMAIKRFKCSDKALLKRIPAKAFADCGNLKEVTLPEGLEEIGEEAFLGCSEVMNFVIPGSVKSIGDRAFAYCSSLTNAQIAFGVESIGEKAFLDCWRISEVDIPSTVKTIGTNAFGGDSSIIRVGLRGDIRKISEVFSNYAHIREFIIKEGEGVLKDRLFAGCSELKDVRIFGDCPDMENEGQYLYASAGKISEPITTYVTQGSYGWNGRKNSTALPQSWPLSGSYRHAIAYWDVPTYLCEFDSNGGSLGVQVTNQYSEKNFILPPEPTQSGYMFAGWWTSPVGGIHITEKNIFIEGVYQRLYAHWVKARTVILDANGGTITTNAMMYVEQTTYGVLPAPTRTGYAFGGWEYNGQTIVSNTTIKTDADHKLLAQWNAIKYTVKFNANYGTGSAADMLCVYDKSYSTPSGGFLNGREKLAGWALSPQGEVAYKCGESVKNLSSTNDTIVTLYAVYRKSAYADLLPDLLDEYGAFVPGKEIEPIDFTFAAGWTIKGLPAGLKYNAKTGLITGKPAKSGKFTVTLTRTYDKRTAATIFEVVSAAEDKAAIEIKVGDMKPVAEIATDEFAAIELPVGVVVDWSIKATALSDTTVKVAGLPSGLKLVQDKKTKAYSIQGTPTAASKVDKFGNITPSIAKFTVTTAGKNSRVFVMPITTTALPAWAVGTFNGGLVDSEGNEIGLVSLTTTAAGKISGKILKSEVVNGDVIGQAWTLAAASFDSFDEEGAYHATLTAKSGKLPVETYKITLDEYGIEGEGLVAYQNLWKTSDELKTLGKELAVITKSGYDVEDGITLKISSSGAVTATKTYSLGYNSKGKELTYKASCSTTLIPLKGEGYTHVAYIYFAPNAKKGFDGYSTCLYLNLPGESYVDLEIDGLIPDEVTSAFEPITLNLGDEVNWKLESKALTATTIKASGLPKGLKLVQDKNTKAYSIQGVPTAASKLDKQKNIVPSLVKLTVTTAGKNSRVFTLELSVTHAVPSCKEGKNLI